MSDPTYPSPHPAPSSNDPVPPNTKPNLVPVFVEIPADLLTPVAAYLKVANESDYGFLLESVLGGENLARYSFVGAGEFASLHMPRNTDWTRSDPMKTVRTGEGFDFEGDPLAVLENELEGYRYAKLHQIPTFTGGTLSRSAGST